eukprot:TRINITY_DN22419_c0_g1_i1.p1 TRINITY_DN22419_c0_g1~~TRINITY_DN22419_c0_g1_i1.p1  ORF type:complete len:1667 (-),score=201.69 TRINITY_DN22419_c0_g1_i1:141-5141(-)
MRRFQRAAVKLLVGSLALVVSSPSVSNLAFTDTNSDANYIEGVITWSPPTTRIDSVASYTVWMAYDRVNAMGTELWDKTHYTNIPRGTNQLDIWYGGMPRGTIGSLPANYFVVLAFRSDLGGYQPISEAGTLAIYDSSSTVLVATQVMNVAFADADGYRGWIGGVVSWDRVPGEDYGFVSHFQVLLADDAAGANLRFIASTPSDSDRITIPMDTELGSSGFVHVYCWNPNGRAFMAASAPITDLSLRTKTATTTSTVSTTTTSISSTSESSTLTRTTSSFTASSSTTTYTSTSSSTSPTITSSSRTFTTTTVTATSATSSSTTTSSSLTSTRTSTSSISSTSSNTATSTSSGTTSTSVSTSSSTSSSTLSTSSTASSSSSTASSTSTSASSSTSTLSVSSSTTSRSSTSSSRTPTSTSSSSSTTVSETSSTSSTSISSTTTTLTRTQTSITSSTSSTTGSSTTSTTTSTTTTTRSISSSSSTQSKTSTSSTISSSLSSLTVTSTSSSITATSTGTTSTNSISTSSTTVTASSSSSTQTSTSTSSSSSTSVSSSTTTTFSASTTLSSSSTSGSSSSSTTMSISSTSSSSTTITLTGTLTSVSSSTSSTTSSTTSTTRSSTSVSTSLSSTWTSLSSSTTSITSSFSTSSSTSFSSSTLLSTRSSTTSSISSSSSSSTTTASATSTSTTASSTTWTITSTTSSSISTLSSTSSSTASTTASTSSSSATSTSYTSTSFSVSSTTWTITITSSQSTSLSSSSITSRSSTTSTISSTSFSLSTSTSSGTASTTSSNTKTVSTTSSSSSRSITSTFTTTSSLTSTSHSSTRTSSTSSVTATTVSSSTTPTTTTSWSSSSSMTSSTTATTSSTRTSWTSTSTFSSSSGSTSTATTTSSSTSASASSSSRTSTRSITTTPTSSSITWSTTSTFSNTTSSTSATTGTSSSKTTSISTSTFTTSTHISSTDSSTTSTNDCARLLVSSNPSTIASIISFNLSSPLSSEELLQAGLLQVLLPENVSKESLSMTEVDDSQGSSIILVELLVSDSSSPKFSADTLFRYFSCLRWIFLPGAAENIAGVHVAVGFPTIANVSLKGSDSVEAHLNFAEGKQQLAAVAAIPVLAIAVFAAGGAGMLSYRKSMTWRKTWDVSPRDEEAKAKQQEADDEEVSLDVMGKNAITARSAELLRELKISLLRQNRLRKLSAMSLHKLVHQEERQMEILTEVHQLSQIHRKVRDAARAAPGFDATTLETFFQNLGSDGSAALDQEQLEKILRTQLKMTTSDVSRHELELLLENLDKDGTGYVDTSELVKFLTSDDPVGSATDIVREGLARLSQQRISLAWQAPDSPTGAGDRDAVHGKLRRGLGMIELAELLETRCPVTPFANMHAERHDLAEDMPEASSSSRMSPNPSPRQTDEDSTSSACGVKRVKPVKIYTPPQTSPSSVDGHEYSKNRKLRPCKTQDVTVPGTPDSEVTPSSSHEVNIDGSEPLENRWIRPCRLQMARTESDWELASQGPSPRPSDEITSDSSKVAEAGAPKYIKPIKVYTPLATPESSTQGSERSGCAKFPPCRVQTITLPGTPDSSLENSGLSFESTRSAEADGPKRIKPIKQVFMSPRLDSADIEQSSPEGSVRTDNPHLRPCKLQQVSLPGTPDGDFIPYSMPIARSRPVSRDS